MANGTTRYIQAKNVSCKLYLFAHPYFPFSTRIFLNQHHWLAHKMKQAGIRFEQSKNAFRQCSDPAALQKMADSLTSDDLTRCGHKWINRLVPFLQAKERREAGCWRQLFFAQVEYCENLIFRQRAALDELGERLLDANRHIGRPDKLTVIFGRRINKRYDGKLQTEIEDLHLGNPVMRSYYKNGFAKHYVRDHDALRIEAATNDVKEDYKINKAVENLSPLREKLQGITARYQEVQQDILETFLDRGELRRLAEPTVLANGKRIPGLKLDHPRQLAVMSSLVWYASPTSPRGTLSTPRNYRLVSPKPSASRSRSARSVQYVMNCQNSEPKVWSKSSHILAAITFCRTGTGSVWCSSNCSTRSMRPSPPASSIRIAEIESCRKTG